MMLFILSCLMLFLAGIANGAMDILVHKFGLSVFSNVKNNQFWNPELSWFNKWSDTAIMRMTYNEERFWGSSRWFVFLTDGWHLCKAIFLLFIVLAALFFRLPDWSIIGLHVPLFWNGVLCFLMLKGSMSLGFTISYHGFWLKSNKLPITNNQ